MLYIVVFFIFFAMVNFFVFAIYAKALLLLASFNTIIKGFFGIVAYLLLAAYVISPFFISSWLGVEYQSSDNNLFAFLVLYIVSIIPAGWFFKKNYLKQLKQRGYFSSRYENL